MFAIRNNGLRTAAAVLAVLLAAAGPIAPARADVPDPTVEGPITGGLKGYPLWDSWFDLSELGYEEAEYFVSGTARRIGSTQTAPYTTRIIVTRPADPGDFNGTVVLEWTNVTAQFENAVDVISAHEFLLRKGYAYVHASAQAAGICCTPFTPKVWDPVRYAPLSHPGDDFSFDMFSQMAKAIRAPAGTDPMAGLKVKRIIAAGQSQSAGRLDTYVRQVQADAGVIDAFLIHGGGGKQFDAPPAAPVLHLLSDREATPAEPNQTHNYRLWEVAGSAHSDFYIGLHQELGQGPRFAGAPKQPASADEDLHATTNNYGEQPHPMSLACILAGSQFPMRYSVNAAIHHLDRWVKTGGAQTPPAGPRYQFQGSTLARDELGNALGGIRLPPVEVPIARYVSTSCNLGGITVPLTEPEIAARYPTHAEYFAAFAEATRAARKAGFLLPQDAADLLERACAAKNRWPFEASAADCE